MASCNTDQKTISRKIRLEIAKDYLKRKKTWDLPSDARTIIENLIQLVEEDELDRIPPKG